MARYTKKDREGHYYIEFAGGKHYTDVWGHLYGEAINKFAELENADVVPKSEVEAMQRLYGEKLEVAEALIATLNKTKSEVAREIFEDIDGKMLCFFPSSSFVNAPHTTHYQLLAMLAELKKKYTEGEQRND